MITLANADDLQREARAPAVLPASTTAARLSLRTTGAAAVCVAALSLTACGTTRNFVDHSALSIVPPSTNPRSAVATIFSSNTPLYISLCNARRSTGECLPGDSGITARGVGGLLFPLSLHVRGIRVGAVHETADSTNFDAAFDSKVDAIAPLCQSSRVHAVYSDDGSLSLRFGKFYCNWALVGNVIVDADLSIDSISVKERTFTGFYRITFHGTGNAAGSGYFRASIEPAARTAVRSMDAANESGNEK
jgi:hypothetical protein